MKRTIQVRPGRVRRGPARAALFAVATAAAVAAFAAPASASVSINSFSVTPSTTQAGAAPNLKLVSDFAYGFFSFDSVDNATISLAPGLLENPTVPAQCSVSQFDADACPASSWIGTGSVTATSPVFFGVPAPFDTNLYLVTPGPGQVARVGLIINVFGFPLESTLAPISIRSATGDVGININLGGLPNNYHGLPLSILGLNLTIFGTVDGQSFTRNPTACVTTLSRITANSYGAQNQSSTGTSSFTPTGCASLPFHPGATASATLDATDAGVGYSTTFTQTPAEAAIKTISVTTPPSLSPNLAVIANACTASDLTTCPSVGSATETTPFLSTPLTGKIVLQGHSGALPTPAIVFTAPIALVQPGTVKLSSGPPLTLTTTFDNLPDLPMSKLTVTFNGGLTGLFLANKLAICTSPQNSSGTLTGQNGATETGAVPTAISGCPAASAASTAPSSAAADVAPAASRSTTAAARTHAATKATAHARRHRLVRHRRARAKTRHSGWVRRSF